MMFEPEHLLERLRQPLPGISAQMRMAMTGRMDAMRQADLSAARQSAVLILLYKKDGEWHLPLIQRTASDGVHSRQIAFPGGRFDDTDEDLVQTAIRECWEEVGVRPAREDVLGVLSDLYIPPSNFLVTPVVACVRQVPTFVTSPAEVAELYEVPLSLLKHPGTQQELRVEARKGIYWQVPGFSVYGQTVWGATAMILSELLHIVDEIGSS